MNYLITTSYQDQTYSHIVEGLTSTEIQNIFDPLSIVPLTEEDTTGGDFDLLAKAQYDTKQFQVISHVKKVIEFYARWKHMSADAKQTRNVTVSLLSIDSKKKPLTTEQSQQLLAQLESQFQQKQQTITPAVKKLIEDTKKDISDFLVRFKGYTDEKELDILQTRSHDLDMFVSQGKLPEIKDRMEHIITKMELLESNYVKQINLDEDKPLGSFSKELHTIMNQNRLFRYHGLNQLSGGSKVDFVLYKLISSWRLRWDAVSAELHNAQDAFSVAVAQMLRIFTRGMIFGLVLLYIYKLFVDTKFTYSFLALGITGLVSMMCYAVAKKQIAVSLTAMLIFVVMGYMGYEFLRINFGL
ncbi:MAG: hypothetical protein WC004_00635 [Candidatus Absconditabacterales bacterium]